MQNAGGLDKGRGSPLPGRGWRVRHNGWKGGCAPVGPRGELRGACCGVGPVLAGGVRCEAW
eukprot:11173506-Lingulodinium_polyedra.AAC.1